MGNADSHGSTTKPQKLLLKANDLASHGKTKQNGSLSFEDNAVVIESQLEKVDWAARTVYPPEFVFPFENLVFESGGLRSLAFCGVLEYLELSGCLSNMKRFAGAGYGAVVAVLVTVGFSWREISTMLERDISAVTKGGLFGNVSFLPNVLRGYGVTSFGEEIHNKLGKWLKDKTGNQDITFQEVMDKYNRELCVIVTNVNHMCTEYFHPKTTPDLAVRNAVQMSLTIPGVFSPRTETVTSFKPTCFVDGGLLCNYPLHCFDGWFLSMKQDHTFMKMQYPFSYSNCKWEKKHEFQPVNEKTIGITIYSNCEVDFMRAKLESRMGVLIPSRPAEETDLYRYRQELHKQKKEMEQNYINICASVNRFYEIMEKHQLSNLEVLDKKYLKDAFHDERTFTSDDTERVFGKKIDLGLMFENLDLNGDGLVCPKQLKRKVEQHSRNVAFKLRDFDRKDIAGFISFMSALHTTVSRQSRLDYIQESDVERTIGINTGYINTGDENFNDADKQFLIDRGYNSARAFLQYYVAKNKCSKKHTTIMRKIVETIT